MVASVRIFINSADRFAVTAFSLVVVLGWRYARRLAIPLSRCREAARAPAFEDHQFDQALTVV